MTLQYIYRFDLQNDCIHNDYKNNHSKQNPPMKSHSREDELQEQHLIRNTPPAMIALTGRRRVGKTDCIIEGK